MIEPPLGRSMGHATRLLLAPLAYAPDVPVALAAAPSPFLAGTGPGLVVVPVAFVGRVAVAVVQVVDVVAVRYARVPAALAVPVVVALVRGVPRGLALVPVAAVRAVQMAVVRVVDVVAVGYLGVPALRAVDVLVGGVFLMESGHGAHLKG